MVSVKFVSQLINFIATTSGRDKTSRTVQYAMKMVAYMLRQAIAANKAAAGTPPALMADYAGRMEALGGAMGMTRKVLRLGRPLALAKTTMELFAMRGRSDSYKLLKGTGNFSCAMYFLVDHIVWLQKIGVLKATKEQTERVDWWANVFWLGECLFSMAAIINECNDLATEASELSRRVVLDNDADSKEAKEINDSFRRIQNKQRDLAIDFTRNLIDVPVCLQFMNLAPSVSPGMCGFLGLVTSLIGCYQGWPEK